MCYYYGIQQIGSLSEDVEDARKVRHPLTVPICAIEVCLSSTSTNKPNVEYA